MGLLVLLVCHVVLMCFVDRRRRRDREDKMRGFREISNVIQEEGDDVIKVKPLQLLKKMNLLLRPNAITTIPPRMSTYRTSSSQHHHLIKHHHHQHHHLIVNLHKQLPKKRLSQRHQPLSPECTTTSYWK